jgi:hypothetical protein
MSRLILLLLAAAIVAVFLLSPRSWSMKDTPRVVEVATLPEAAGDQVLAGVYPNMVLPYLEGEAEARMIASTVRQRDRRIGYVYREVSLLKMPFWAYEDGGLVVYRELPAGYSIAPVTPDQVAALEAATGKRFSGHGPSLWRHLWGWLFAAGFVLWWFVAGHEESRRREVAEGDEAGAESAR